MIYSVSCLSFRCSNISIYVNKILALSKLHSCYSAILYIFSIFSLHLMMKETTEICLTTAYICYYFMSIRSLNKHLYLSLYVFGRAIKWLFRLLLFSVNQYMLKNKVTYKVVKLRLRARSLDSRAHVLNYSSMLVLFTL